MRFDLRNGDIIFGERLDGWSFRIDSYYEFFSRELINRQIAECGGLLY